MEVGTRSKSVTSEGLQVIRSLYDAVFLRPTSNLAVLIEEFQRWYNAEVTGSYDGMLGKTAFRGLLIGKVGLRERGGLRTQSLKIHTFWYINHLRSAWVADVGSFRGCWVSNRPRFSACI
jgi:hypothetical protein